MKLKSSLFIGSIFSVAATAALHATAYTWNGAGTLWSSTGSWTPASTGLTNSDDVTLDSTGVANLTTAMGGGNQSVRSITFNSSSAYTVRLYSSTTTTTTTRTLTVGTGGITVSAGNHTILGAKLGSGNSGPLLLSPGTFNIASACTLTFDVRLRQSGTGIIYTKSGPGTLVFNADSGGGTGWTHSGFTVSQGVLRFTAANAFGTSGNDYAVSSGAAIEISGGVSQTVNTGGTITLNGTGIGGAGALRSVSGDNGFNGTGDVILNDDSSIGVDAGTLAINTVVSGAAANDLTKVGSGTLTLNGTNTYAGLTTISAGTLALGSAGSINNSSAVAIAAGTSFDVSAIADYTLGSSTALSASGTGTTAGTDAAVIKGGTTVSLGSQPVTLTHNFTPGGDLAKPCLHVSQGALTLNNNAFTINGAVLGVGTYRLIQVGDGTTGTLNQNATPSYTVSGTAIDGTKGNIISADGSGNLILTVTTGTGTTTTVSRSAGTDPSTYGSTLTFKATVMPASGSAVPTGTVQFLANNTNYGSPVPVVQDGSTTNGIALLDASTLPYSASPNTITAVYTASGVFIGSSDTTGFTQTINQAPVTLSGAAAAKMFDGTTDATITGTLSGVLPADSANVAINWPGTFDSAAVGNNINLTAGTCTLTGSAAGNYALIPPTPPATGSIRDTSIWGNSAGGVWQTPANWSAATNNLVATGANNTADFNQLSLAADTTVTLNAPVTIGNLVFGNTAASPEANWTLNNNGTAANRLTLAGTSPTVTVNPLGSGKSATISAVMDGTNGLTKAGTGTLVLSGANTFTGTTTVSAGTLQIGNGVSSTAGTLGNNSSATIATGATLRVDRYFLVGTTNASDAYPYAGTLSGDGSVQIAATRRLDFSSSQTTSGNLSFTVDGLLGIRTSAGVTAVHLGELTGSGSIQRGGNAVGSTTLFVGGKNTSSSYSGAIVSAELSVEKVGSGTLTLTGTSTYGGTTTVTDGTLALGNATNTLADTTAVSIGNATLAVAAGCTDTVGTLDVTAAATINLGSNTSVLTFASSSAIDWTGGTLTLTGTFVPGASIKFGVGGLTGDQLTKISATGWTGFVLDANGFLTATPTGGGFSSWITGTFANGTVPAGKQGPNDDPDNDGVSNLVEYAIAGQDPTVANPTIGSFKANTLSFTKRGDATGLTYAIEESISLGVAPTPWTEVSGGSYTNNSTTISYSFPAGAPPKNFLRLKVTGP